MLLDFSPGVMEGLDKVRGSLGGLAYVARGTVIQWCLALANHLQRAQAQAITRAAKAKGQPAGVNIPPPTFPNPSRWESPPPRVPFTLYMRPPSIDASRREIKHDDFDEEPTALYTPIPTNGGRVGAS